MRISIKIKLSVFLALLLLAAVSALSILVLNGIRENQKQQYEEHLVQQGEIASNYIKRAYLMESINDPKEFLVTRAQELANRFDLMSGMHVILYDMSGKKLSDSMSAVGNTDVKSILAYALQDKNTYLEDGNNIIFLAPLHNSSEQIGVIQFSYSIEEYTKFYAEMSRLILIVGIFVFVACFISAYLYTYPLAKDISKLKNSTRISGDGSYGDVVLLKRNDELGDLSRSIHNMGLTINKNTDEMREEQIKLNLAVGKLEMMGNMQKKFIGNVTHEFRTPLTVIKAYTDLLDMYPEDKNLLTEARMNIEKETMHLSAMVEKVLELTYMEKYDFVLQMRETDIYDVLTEICENMKGKLRKFGLKLHTSFEHQTIMADRESLMQIFINLIDNAIKYNRTDGEIWVSCSKKDNGLYVLVKDTGIGIPSEERDKIFEPFYRVNIDRSSRSGSTGLGLALVKRLVDGHGAVISILDAEEEGASFEIRFPIK